MNYSDFYIEELIDLRESKRKEKDWKSSDEIRDYLDSKDVIIFDTENGQEIYHNYGGRKKVIELKKRDKKANELWDSWLYSMQESAKILTIKNIKNE